MVKIRFAPEKNSASLADTLSFAAERSCKKAWAANKNHLKIECIIPYLMTIEIDLRVDHSTAPLDDVLSHVVFTKGITPVSEILRIVASAPLKIRGWGGFYTF